MSKHDQINPAHYRRGRLQVIDQMELLWGTKSTIEYCQITAYKYRMRMGLKKLESGAKVTAVQDFKKARWYENKAEELEKKVENGKEIKKPYPQKG